MEPLLIVGGAFGLLALSVAAWWGARKIGSLSAERSVGSTDEDGDAFGQTAMVVHAEGSSVRILFQGTHWPAQLIHGAAAVGMQVRIVDRDNLIWIVEPVEPARSLP